MALLVILLMVLFCCSRIDAASQFKDKPPAVQNVTEGEKLRLTWIYDLLPADTLNFDKIFLGIFFSNGFTPTYMEVSKTGTVIDVLPKFVGRLKWNGDLLTNKKKIEFLLDPVNETDAGKFTCGVFLGVLKGYKVDTVTLNVWVRPKITRVSETSLVLNAGDNAAITCTAVGKPTPFVSWNKRQGVGQLHMVTEPSHGNSSLVLMSVDKQSASEYVCLAENPTKMNTNMSSYLNVKYLMAEAKELGVSKVTAVLGQKEKICCPIMGYPPPFFTWTLPNGTIVSSFDKCIVVSSTGKYSCEASNEIGTEEANVFFGSAEETRNATWKGEVINWTDDDNVMSYAIDIRDQSNVNSKPWFVAAGVPPYATVCPCCLDRDYDGQSLDLIVRISALLKSGQTVMWVSQKFFQKTFVKCGLKA